MCVCVCVCVCCKPVAKHDHLDSKYVFYRAEHFGPTWTSQKKEVLNDCKNNKKHQNYPYASR